MPEELPWDVFLSRKQADKPRVRRLTERLPFQLEARNSELGIARLCLSPAALVGSDWVGLACAAEASERRRKRSTVGRGNCGSRDLRFRDPATAGSRFIPLRLADGKLPDTLRRTTPPAKSLSAAHSGLTRRNDSPGEGFKRPGPPLIKMDAAVKAKVGALFGNGSDNPRGRS